MGLKVESFPFLKKMILSTANLSHFCETAHLEVLVIVRFCRIRDKSILYGIELFKGDELFIVHVLLVKLVPFREGIMKYTVIFFEASSSMIEHD